MKFRVGPGKDSIFSGGGGSGPRALHPEYVTGAES